MGLLDDAIREHLDLKRRRGADPSEVERAEREALGPVRRNPTPAELAEAGGRGARPTAPPPTTRRARRAGRTIPCRSRPPTPASRPDYDEPVAGARAGPARVPGARDTRRGTISPAEASPSRRSRSRRRPPTSPHRAAAPRPPPAMGGAGPETAEYNVEDALAAEEHAASRRRRRRARGDARVPPGHAGSRPPVVRAAPAQGLRLRRVGTGANRPTPTGFPSIDG